MNISEKNQGDFLAAIIIIAIYTLLGAIYVLTTFCCPTQKGNQQPE